MDCACDASSFSMDATLALSCCLCLWLRLRGAIYGPDSFVMMPRYCANLKAIRYESMSLNGIIADKSHCVIVAYLNVVLWLPNVPRGEVHVLCYLCHLC